MNKAKETCIDELIKRDKGADMKDKIYKKACGHCGNDLVKPYIFCHFCGYRVIGGTTNGQ